MTKTVHSRKSGFSLVEITVAIGVIAFALVGLMGLLSASLTAGKESEDDTRYVSMSQQILDRLRSGAFEDIPFNTSLDSLVPAVLPPVYFDYEGFWVAPGATEWPAHEAGIIPATAVYKCSVFVDVDAETVAPEQGGMSPQQRINLLRVHLAFTPLNKNVQSMEDVSAKDPIIHATIPRY